MDTSAKDEAWRRERWSSLLRDVARSLGKNPEKTRHEFASATGNFYVSDVSFAKLRFDDEDECLEVVVKRIPEKSEVRENLKADTLFHNEILFYRRYAPHVGNCPRLIHAEESRDSVIVLEDIGSRGYRTCPAGDLASLERTIAAIRTIARFHARGYVAKERREEEFFALVEDIQDGKFVEMATGVDPVRDRMVTFVDLMTPRSVRFLRRRGYDPEFCDRVERIFENAFHAIMIDCLKPVEPLATLCHGDCTLGNVLFKDRQDAGYDAMLIDFGQIRYGTPALDLSTFLLLSCAGEMRRTNLDRILDAYHDALIDCLRDAGIENLERFSRRAIREDYKRRALFGFVITTFFLPISMGLSDLTVEQLVCYDPEKLYEIVKDLGGDEMSRNLADTLLELKDLGALDHILSKDE